MRARRVTSQGSIRVVSTLACLMVLVPALARAQAPVVADPAPPAAVEEPNANPPPLLGGSAEPSAAAEPPAPAPEAVPTAEEAAAPVEEGNANPPPSLTGETSPTVAPPAVARPFAARFAGMEPLLLGISVAGGLAASVAAALAAGLVFASVSAGRLVWDFPRVVAKTGMGLQDRGTEGARIFGGNNVGIMAGGLLFSILSSAFIAGGVALLVGMFSQDWETLIGPTIAVGLLAAGVVAAAGASAFVVSMLIPIPLVWMGTFAVALLTGAVVPPLAVALGQVLTKRPRTVPGGLLNNIPFSNMLNPSMLGLNKGTP